MKSFIPYIILLFTSLQFPQQLSLFENIPLGSSKETVINEMKIKNLKVAFERDDVLGFNGGGYSYQAVYFWAFHFYNDKLHTAYIVFKKTPNLNELRGDIIHNITQKFGVESSERLDDDGNLANTWYFVDSEHSPTDLINLILYETAKGDTTYQLTFTNIELFQESEQQGE